MCTNAAHGKKGKTASNKTIQNIVSIAGPTLAYTAAANTLMGHQKPLQVQKLRRDLQWYVSAIGRDH